MTTATRRLRETEPLDDGRGVYGIEHIPSGAIYIGSTKSFRQRRYSHQSDLSRNTHPCEPLQRQWNASDDSQFQFIIIQQMPDGDLLAAERKCIDEYMASGIPVYNIIWGNGSSPEVIERRAAGHRGLKPAPELVQRRAESRSCMWNGFTSPNGAHYSNIKNLAAFCREHELNISHMRKVSKGIRNSHRGWVRLGDQDANT